MLVGVVGGSDLAKQQEQLGDVWNTLDYAFPENGTTAYDQCQLIHSTCLSDHIDNHEITRLINFCLHYIANLDIPVKRGTFIEYRKGMINISPIGRNASATERDDFEKYDKHHHIRDVMVKELKANFDQFTFSI